MGNIPLLGFGFQDPGWYHDRGPEGGTRAEKGGDGMPHQDGIGYTTKSQSMLFAQETFEGLEWRDARLGSKTHEVLYSHLAKARKYYQRSKTSVEGYKRK